MCLISEFLCSMNGTLCDEIELHLRLDGEKLLWDVVQPFDLIINSFDNQRWRPLVDMFRNGEVKVSISLSHIQTVFSTFGINLTC